MVRNSSPAMLAATAIVSLAIGFGAATLLPAPPAFVEPIVDADAWQEEAPAALATQQASYASADRASKCDPWNVSEIAMEEVLDEMIRRGWRTPRQGDAVALLDAAQTMGIGAVDPNAPMPWRRTWTSSESRPDESEAGEITAADPETPVEPEPAPPEPAKPEPPPA